MTRKVFALFIPLALFQLGCAGGSDAQTKNDNRLRADANVREEPLRILILLDGLVTPDSIGDRETLLKQPVPTVRIKFDCAETAGESCANGLSADLPSNLNEDLENFWIESLSFRYKAVVEGFPSAQSNFDASMEFTNVSQSFQNKMIGTTVATTAGPRVISSRDALEIVGKLNMRTVELARLVKTK